jgi:hypothetical protein
MRSYRLRRVLRSTGGTGTVSFDSRTIEALDLAAAIREASADAAIQGGRMVETVVLSTPAGEILWTGVAAASGATPTVES